MSRIAKWLSVAFGAIIVVPILSQLIPEGMWLPLMFLTFGLTYHFGPELKGDFEEIEEFANGADSLRGDR